MTDLTIDRQGLAHDLSKAVRGTEKTTRLRVKGNKTT